MILKSIILTFGFTCIFFKEVVGSAYSVYVQSGPDLAPTQFVKYGPPAVASPQIAEYRASVSPFVSLPPVPAVVSPCVSPCIISPPLNTNAKFVSYNPPISTLPIVVPPKDDKSSYEYSYVVYDDKTGDQKAQRELSDGSVVRGQYSFIQPDGYIREVQYTADDLTGFNAVVKSYLPPSQTVGETEKPETDEKNTEEKKPPPCTDVKNEALKTTSPEIFEKLDELVQNETLLLEEAILYSGQGTPEDRKLFEEDMKLVKAADDLISGTTTNPTEKPTETPTPKASVLPTAPTTTSSPAATTTPQQTQNTALVSYDSILKCVQAAIEKANKNNDGIPASPLTYIILNKPC